MNVKLRYLYRDAGNYKNFGEIIFTNLHGLSLAHIESLIRESLIEGEWFVANKWQLPDLHFKEFDWDSELDHGWHEYQNLEEIEDAASDGRDVREFLELISPIPIAK